MINSAMLVIRFISRRANWLVINSLKMVSSPPTIDDLKMVSSRVTKTITDVIVYKVQTVLPPRGWVETDKTIPPFIVHFLNHY